MKKLIALILVLLMIVPCTVSCGEKEELKYVLLDDGTYGVTRKAASGTTCEHLEIPAEYKGQPVTTILSEAFRLCDFRSVTIPESVTTIEEAAFAQCYNLTSVTLPTSLTNLEASAFVFCYALVEVQNLSSLEIVADYVGEDGYLVTNMAFETLLHVYGASGKSKIKTTDNGWVLYDDVLVLDYKGGSKEITVPAGATVIRACVEADDEIESITIPTSVTRIDKDSIEAKYGVEMEIVYKGTVEQWEKIEVGLESSQTVTCTDGSVPIS